MDAVLADGDIETTNIPIEQNDFKEDQLDFDDGIDIDLDFSKKKKKKKKTFNLDDPDAGQPESKEVLNDVEGNKEDLGQEENFDDLLDLSKMKKKKKKKKDLDELMAEADDKQEDKENGIFF